MRTAILLLGLAGCTPSSMPAPFWTEGHWIWQAQEGPPNSWICFRKSMKLDALPEQALLRVGVDSRYWLWINGTLVVFDGGLKRGPTPTGGYFDEVDIRKFLQPGPNSFAILVWYWGKDGFSHKDSGRGGLWLEAKGIPIASDASWKMRVHPAYFSPSGEPISFRLPEQNVGFDARKELGDWIATAFDDGDWDSPVDKGLAPSEPWGQLWPRPIPLWRFSELQPYEAETAQTGLIRARLPYNLQLTPYLKIDAPAGQTITIHTDHYAFGSTYSVRAEYITREGEQEFEALGWMNGHEVHYAIPDGVKVLALRYRTSGYDTDLIGSFHCDDAFYDQLWKKAQRTLYVSMRDSFMDCPDRERAQWWGDVVLELGESFYALDQRAHLLGRKALRDLAFWRMGAVLHSPAPAGNYSLELPQQMLASIGGFATYALYTGDVQVIHEVYPAVQDYLALWQIDGEGLVVHRAGGWDWSDWGQDFDVALLDNGWYALALQGAIALARLTGNDADIPQYEQRLVSLKNNFDRLFWNGTAYRSPGHTGKTDDRGNGLAVVAGLAKPERWNALRTHLRTTQLASPYLEKQVLEALYLMEDADGALDRMKQRYGAAVASADSTLPEIFGSEGFTGTRNHGWSGGPLTLLSQYAAGIAPTSSGFTEYQVLPRPGRLNHIETTVPTLQGPIVFRFDRTESQIVLELDSPAGTTALVGIPKEGGPLQSIAVMGPSGFESLDENNRYVRYRVPPGQWRFVASR